MFQQISKNPIAAAFSSKLEQLKGKDTAAHTHTDKPVNDVKPAFGEDTLTLSAKPKPMHGAPVNAKDVEKQAVNAAEQPNAKGGEDVKQALDEMKGDLEGIDQAIDELDEKLADEKNCERPDGDEKPAAGEDDVKQQDVDAKLEALDEKLPCDHGGEAEAPVEAK